MPLRTVARQIVFAASFAALSSLGIATFPASASETARAPARSASAAGEVFVTYRHIDPMAGIEAFRLLIPKGWRVTGSITWSANPALPAQSRFRFYNPRRPEEMNFFPTQAYFWTNNPIFLRTNPPGSMRFGTRVKRPISLRKAFETEIFPRFRTKVSAMQLVVEKAVPELAQLAIGEPVAGVRASAAGGKFRVLYGQGDKHLEEEIYATVSQFVTDMPRTALSPGYFINYWYIDYMFSFRAERGRLDARSKTFQTMIYSMQINPRWYAKVVNTREALAKRAMQGIREIGRLGEIIARSASRMREDQQRDWERRQHAKDRIVQNFSDHIRGVERYYDPLAGKQVELPSGYGNAWANNLGEYVVSESPSFNPNIGSNLNWQRLTAVR